MLAVSNPFLCCEMKWINYLSKKKQKIGMFNPLFSALCQKNTWIFSFTACYSRHLIGPSACS